MSNRQWAHLLACAWIVGCTSQPGTRERFVAGGDGGTFVPEGLRDWTRNRRRLGLVENQAVLYLVSPAPARSASTPEEASAPVEPSNELEGAPGDPTPAPDHGAPLPSPVADAPRVDPLPDVLDDVVEDFLKQAFDYRETRASLADLIERQPDGPVALLTFEAEIEDHDRVAIVCTVWRINVEAGAVESAECALVDRAVEPIREKGSPVQLREALRLCLNDHIATSLLTTSWLDFERVAEGLAVQRRQSLTEELIQ